MAERNYIPDPRVESDQSSRQYDCCTACVSPDAPSNVNALAAGAFVIDISWTDNSSDETGFDIRWRNNTTGSDFTNSGSVPAGSTTGQVTVTGATDGDVIEVQVRAAGSDCDSDWVSDTVIVSGNN